ncbi:SRPBCC domain-containing protein, partial [Candidatus Bathyarchaeota archaeon]|nr:SRPBCC domain-containing protein [Candidatus Bathyarchaeota archaeon]
MTVVPRQVRKQTVISIPPETAWNGWTSVVGVTSFFAPKANIEAKVGGLYELFFDLNAPRGFQGTEGCRILNLDPPNNLAFEFIAPPQFPNVRRVRTRVDVVFDEVLKGGLVKVSVIHSGFVEGEEWDESFDFFSWSWELVLGRFQHRFTARSIDWNHPYFPPGLTTRPARKLRD